LEIDYTINISASPYHLYKNKARVSIAKKFAIETDSTLIYCNLGGGQDELVFAGESFVINQNGELLAKAKQFEEDLLIFNTDQTSRIEKNLETIDEVYQALVLGTRDYIEKNRL
jgi:predicted amidohydrolase